MKPLVSPLYEKQENRRTIFLSELMRNGEVERFLHQDSVLELSSSLDELELLPAHDPPPALFSFLQQLERHR